MIKGVQKHFKVFVSHILSAHTGVCMIRLERIKSLNVFCNFFAFSDLNKSKGARCLISDERAKIFIFEYFLSIFKLNDGEASQYNH